MKVDISDAGGAYQIFVAEDNSTVHVRLLPNDAVGMDGHRARVYSPDLSRFLQQDPAGMVDGANVYAYVGNNPVNNVDPTGMFESPGHEWQKEISWNDVVGSKFGVVVGGSIIWPRYYVVPRNYRPCIRYLTFKVFGRTVKICIIRDKILVRPLIPWFY